MTSPSLISHALSPSDTQKMGLAFSKLMAQYNENEMVLKELKMLDENSTVFKLVGPVLLSQVCVLCICAGHPCCTTTRQPILHCQIWNITFVSFQQWILVAVCVLQRKAHCMHIGRSDAWWYIV